MMSNVEAFKAANVASPVVNGTNTGDGGNIYTLQNGSVWYLSAEECDQTGVPRWLEPPVPATPLTAEQLQAECDAFIKGVDERLAALSAFIEAGIARIKQCFTASDVPEQLQLAMLTQTMKRMDEVAEKYG